MRLNGRVIVITGAARGMGQAMAQHFVREGAKVVAGDVNLAALEETAAPIKAEGYAIVAMRCDVSVRSDAEALVERAKVTYGRVDGLVNNAGVMDQFQPLGILEDDMWDRVMGTNLNGPMYTSRRAVQLMAETGGGSIVNISSFAGSSGASAGAAYTVSKHGLVGLTRNTAWMYVTCGIRCNAIMPGSVETPMRTTVDWDTLDPFAMSRINPMRALIPPSMPAIEIANMALFLLSDESKHVNGAIIPVDGGLRAF